MIETRDKNLKENTVVDQRILIEKGMPAESGIFF